MRVCTVVRCPLPVPERHRANSSDTGRDARVTTQTTTQIFSALPGAWIEGGVGCSSVPLSRLLDTRILFSCLNL
jgi:hypothetical protein